MPVKAVSPGHGLNSVVKHAWRATVLLWQALRIDDFSGVDEVFPLKMSVKSLIFSLNSF